MMAEYVTKEQVVEWFRPYGHTDEGIPYYGLVTDIREMKAADVAPVVHGKWNIMEGTKTRQVCSLCRWDVPEYGKFYAYCPNCGAKMDGGGKARG